MRLRETLLLAIGRRSPWARGRLTYRMFLALAEACPDRQRAYSPSTK